jgi:hypothetical protein
VTKQFTAACILLLEDRGKLKTDDPVSKYVPNAPAEWAKITIYHLRGELLESERDASGRSRSDRGK